MCLSEDPINAQFKYGQPFTFTPVATFLIGTNYPLDLDDTSNAIDRRFLVIPMNAKFKEDSEYFDVDIGERLNTDENLEYIAYKAMLYFSQVMRLGQFPIPKAVETETTNQLLEFNSVKTFLLNYHFKKEKPSELYKKYVAFCEDENYEPVKNKKFGTDIKTIEVNGITYEKRRASDPETGKQKYFYFSSDYRKEDEHNPMLSNFDNESLNNVIQALYANEISKQEREALENALAEDFTFTDMITNDEPLIPNSNDFNINI